MEIFFYLLHLFFCILFKRLSHLNISTCYSNLHLSLLLISLIYHTARAFFLIVKSLFPPAIRRNFNFLSIFCYGSSCYIYAVILEDIYKMLVCKGFSGTLL